MYRKEKVPFLNTCTAAFEQLGYDEIELRSDQNMLGFQSKNLYIGPKNAEILFTAHYDTPGANGILLFAGPVFGAAIGGVVGILPFFALEFLLPLLLPNTAWGNLLSALLTLVLGVAFTAIFFIKNKHNHTDNTSGVVGVFAMAQRVAQDPELRQKCAFVLFDHEEVLPGLLGSRAFVKARSETKNCTVINFDCIGNGDAMAVMTKKKHELWHNISTHLEHEGYCTKKVRGGLFSGGTSDHEPFPRGISLLLQKRSLLGPLYIPRIHTRRDTICDLDGIETLAEAMVNYIKK